MLVRGPRSMGCRLLAKAFTTVLLKLGARGNWQGSTSFCRLPLLNAPQFVQKMTDFSGVPSLNPTCSRCAGITCRADRATSFIFMLGPGHLRMFFKYGLSRRESKHSVHVHRPLTSWMKLCLLTFLTLAAPVLAAALIPLAGGMQFSYLSRADTTAVRKAVATLRRAIMILTWSSDGAWVSAA